MSRHRETRILGKPAHALTSRMWLRCVALLAVCALGACSLTQTAPIKSTFLLDTQRPAQAARVPLSGSLTVAPFRVGEAYAGKPMVFRFEEYRYASDFYNEWFIAPRDIATQRVLEWMQAAMMYQIVVPPGGAGPRADLVLDGLVTEMYGDLRDPAQPAAVLGIQFYVTRPSDQPLRVLFARTLRQTAPMADSSATSLSASLSRALAGILAELEKELSAAQIPANASAASAPTAPLRPVAPARGTPAPKKP